MSRPSFATVEEYLAALPAPARRALETVRALAREVVPDATEQISYQIPALRLEGAYLLYFAGYEKHFGIYPVTDGLRVAMGDALAPHLQNKATLRFSLAEPVPVDLIRRIFTVRADEARAVAAAKAASKATKTAAKRAPRPTPSSATE